jgi:hypothetical protein
LSDDLPIACHHKGVAIFANQPTKRVALVRTEIDKIGKLFDLERLFAIAGDCSWSPEGRLYAGARCIAGIQRAIERREPRPDINREDVEARVAGLASIRWADLDRHCSLFDVDHERAAEREEPLVDADEE